MSQDCTVVSVTYVSSWEEGDVTTSAKLNLDTGEVTDIEVSEDGGDYEILDREYVEVPGCAVQAAVEEGEAGAYWLTSPEDLTALRNHFMAQQGNVVAVEACKGCGASLAGRNQWEGLCYDCALDAGLVSSRIPGESPDQAVPGN